MPSLLEHDDSITICEGVAILAWPGWLDLCVTEVGEAEFFPFRRRGGMLRVEDDVLAFDLVGSLIEHVAIVGTGFIVENDFVRSVVLNRKRNKLGRTHHDERHLVRFSKRGLDIHLVGAGNFGGRYLRLGTGTAGQPDDGEKNQRFAHRAEF